MQLPIPSVNFHLWAPCNMRCGFCFAPFHDVRRELLPKGHMGEQDCLRVIEALAQAGFAKINFAGGEPTLCPWLSTLIHQAKSLNMTTSIVTNGSRLAEGWFDMVSDSLDWIALSIDATNPTILERIGRTIQEGPMGEDDYARVIGLAKEHGIRVKINTVVCYDNWQDYLGAFILRVRPERWKLLQALPVEGQNDGAVDRFVISRHQFLAYVERHRDLAGHGITIVPENNDLMTGSYLMIDPAGRFFDNTMGRYTYSSRILDVGIEVALREVSVDPKTFDRRGGLYVWN